MCRSLTHGGQDVPQVVFADDTVPVLVDDCESLRESEGVGGGL